MQCLPDTAFYCISRHQNSGSFRRNFLKFLKRFNPVHPGHSDIHQHHVKLFLLDYFKGIEAIMNPYGIKTFHFQKVNYTLTVVYVIIHYKNPSVSLHNQLLSLRYHQKTSCRRTTITNSSRNFQVSTPFTLVQTDSSGGKTFASAIKYKNKSISLIVI